MQNRQKILLFLLVLSSSSSLLIHPTFSAYGTIEKVVMSAPSSTSIGQAFQVQATIYTERSG